MGIEILSHSPEATAALAEYFGGFLRAGDVVLLFGGLGAGKTLFVRGVAKAAGIDEDEVSSPSFSLVNRYAAANLDIYHIDLWRLSEEADFDVEIGLSEIFQAENCIVFIEWAERLGSYPIPPDAIRVAIAGDGDSPRRIRIDSESKELLTAVSSFQYESDC